MKHNFNNVITSPYIRNFHVKSLLLHDRDVSTFQRQVQYGDYLGTLATKLSIMRQELNASHRSYMRQYYDHLTILSEAEQELGHLQKMYLLQKKKLS